MGRGQRHVDALEYVGITTGFCRSYRARDCDANGISPLDDLIERTVQCPGTPLAVPGHRGFVARAMAAGNGLTVTVSGPVAVGPVTVPVPVHALAVQAARPGSEALWRALHEDTRHGPCDPLVTWGAAPPAAPWIASKPLLSAGLCREDTGWLDGFGVDLAWTWLRRRQRRMFMD